MNLPDQPEGPGRLVTDIELPGFRPQTMSDGVIDWQELIP